MLVNEEIVHNKNLSTSISDFFNPKGEEFQHTEIKRHYMTISIYLFAGSLFALTCGLISLFSGDLMTGGLDIFLAIFLLSIFTYLKKTNNYLFVAESVIILIGIFFTYLSISGRSIVVEDKVPGNYTEGANIVVILPRA